jgi:hypothetical protein
MIPSYKTPPPGWHWFCAVVFLILFTNLRRVLVVRFNYFFSISVSNGFRTTLRPNNFGFKLPFQFRKHLKWYYQQRQTTLLFSTTELNCAEMTANRAGKRFCFAFIVFVRFSFHR